MEDWISCSRNVRYEKEEWVYMCLYGGYVALGMLCLETP